jgi:hypothetical protein
MIHEFPQRNALFWLARATDTRQHPAGTPYLAYVPGGKIVAVMAFHNASGNDIEVTTAARHFPRHFIRAAFDYIFRVRGMGRVTCKTRPTNLQAISAVERMGARLEGRQRDYYGPDDDALIYGLLKKDSFYGF